MLITLSFLVVLLPLFEPVLELESGILTLAITLLSLSLISTSANGIHLAAACLPLIREHYRWLGRVALSLLALPLFLTFGLLFLQTSRKKPARNAHGRLFPACPVRRPFPVRPSGRKSTGRGTCKLEPT